jgi:DNA-binding transcriptional LysR family regulator
MIQVKVFHEIHYNLEYNTLMELRQLLALVTVAETASFTKAAERLSLTQSAVTRQILALEQETHTRLLDRLGKTVVLTSAGAVLQGYALEMLRLDSEAVHALQDVRSGAGGQLVVGVSSTAAAYLLPPLLSLYRQDRPGVDLSVRTGPSGRVAELVADNQVDVGILMDEPAIAGLKSIKVAEYSISLIVYAGHPLVQATMRSGRGVNLQQVSDLPLILMQKGASLRRSADELLGQAGSEQLISMELDNVEAIKKMIEARLGVSLLPTMSVKDETASGSLIALPIDSPNPPKPSIVVIHRQDKYVSGAMSAFINLVKSNIGAD